MAKRWLLLLTAACTLAMACGGDPLPPVTGSAITDCDGCVSTELGEQLTQAIADEFAEHGDIPGMVVAIRSPQGEYENAFGRANLETGEAMSTNAIFGIGSVHKMFKWTALHLLAQDGLVDLDRAVNDYITEPDLPGVTVRHLMQHSSGMPDLPNIEAYNKAIEEDQTQVFEYDDVLALLDGSSGKNSYGPFSDGSLENFRPGENMSYSSIGPVVGLRIVEEVTGTDALTFTTDEIFERLGLQSTTHMGFEADPDRLTEGYATTDTVNPFFPNPEATMGLSSSNGGAIHSTAGDLVSFGHAVFLDDGFFIPETQAELFAAPIQGPGMRSGNGVIQFDQWQESGWWGHAGFGIRSHSSTLLHQPDLDLTVAVLTNVYTPLDDYETNVAVSDAVLEVFRG